jgi:hypothetical protein
MRPGRGHNFTMSIASMPASGVIVHYNNNPSHKAETWYGLCIDATTKKIRFGLGFDYPVEVQRGDGTPSQRSSSPRAKSVGKKGEKRPVPSSG